jgi:heme-degrading monooxygenase HmoA
MLARVARYEVDPERSNDAIKAFEDSAQDIAAMEGLHAGYILVDSETGAVTTVTFWESQAALDSSETRAAGARQRAIQAVEGDVQSVQAFDVVREFGAS